MFLLSLILHFAEPVIRLLNNGGIGKEHKLLLHNSCVNRESIIDNCSVPLKELFCLPVKFTCNFVDLVLFIAEHTSQSDATAGTMYFEFSGASFTLHVSSERSSSRVNRASSV